MLDAKTYKKINFTFFFWLLLHKCFKTCPFSRKLQSWNLDFLLNLSLVIFKLLRLHALLLISTVLMPQYFQPREQPHLSHFALVFKANFNDTNFWIYTKIYV